MAPLELPTWLAYFDQELKTVIIQLAFADHKADGWTPLKDMARRWKEYLGQHAPTPEDLRFFQKRFGEQAKAPNRDAGKSI